MSSEDPRVLVVGAGPTGLLLAGDLAAAGVPVTVLERRQDESNWSRAFAVHARTLETHDARGLADELIGTGQKLDTLGGFDGVGISMRRLPTRFPFVLVTPQYETERLLLRRAEAHGAEILPGHQVTGLRQQDGHVDVDVRTADGVTSTQRAAYVVGTDGFHSTVRDAIGMPFPGQSVLRSVMLADVRLAEPPSDILRVSANQAGFAFLAPFGDGWYRVMAWNRHHQLPDSEPADMDEIAGITRSVFGTDFGMSEPRWTSRFHNDERQVPHYRVGRVFLAGDAAHVHSPAGGQGMNTGLQDAANLGWKLAAVMNGWAGDTLLDTYHAERYPVGQFVLRLSHGLLRVALLGSDVARRGALLAASAALRVRPAADRGAMMVSGLGISYPPAPGEHPLTGRRMPDVPLADGQGRLYEVLREGRFVLLGEPARTGEAAGWADRVALATRLRQRPGLVLVRPDGYIGWALDDGEAPGRDTALRAALTRWCGTPSGA